MDTNKTDIIKKYFNTDNVIFSFDKKIKLDESAYSPFFIDINGNTVPSRREGFHKKKQLCSLLEKEGIDFDIAAGADHSGIPFTVAVSGNYGKPLVYIRNSNKKTR